MTAHDKNLDRVSTPEPGAAPGSPVTPASHDRATIIVWRLVADTPHDPDAATPGPDDGDSPLTPRLAHHLVAIYSDVHGTVLDLDADPHLRKAVESSGRTYRAIGDSGDPAAQTDLGEPAALVVMRWPRRTTNAPGSDASDLLSRCQRHLAVDGSAIIVVAASVSGTNQATYLDHEQILLPAAQAVGLRHLHDIVPLAAEDGRDSFFYASGRHRTRSAVGKDRDTARQTAVTTLVIFGHPGRRP
jgi:hypothetical protein